jgi:hypothetical protein
LAQFIIPLTAKLNNVSFEGVLTAENMNFEGAELTDTVIPKNK